MNDIFQKQEWFYLEDKQGGFKWAHNQGPYLFNWAHNKEFLI